MRKKDKNRSAQVPSPNGTPTLIGRGSSVQGYVQGQDDICIEGEFQGNISSQGTVYVNKEAKVVADICAQKVFVYGQVQGNIKAFEQLDIGESGAVIGDVAANSLTVLTGGMLTGQCTMDTGKDLNEIGQSSDQMRNEAIPSHEVSTPSQASPQPDKKDKEDKPRDPDPDDDNGFADFSPREPETRHDPFHGLDDDLHIPQGDDDSSASSSRGTWQSLGDLLDEQDPKSDSSKK